MQFSLQLLCLRPAQTRAVRRTQSTAARSRSGFRPHPCARVRSSMPHCIVPHLPCHRLSRQQLHAHRATQQGPTPHTTHPTSSIILGSGISGLAAAKVLSKYCSSVKVVDKDAVRFLAADSTAPDVSQSKGVRRGVAQYNHLHILAGKGLLTLDDLFEGRFIPALKESGAVLSDVVTAFTNYHPAGGRWALPAVAAKGPVLMGQATRHVVESVTRQLLQQSVPEGVVEVIDSTAVTGLLLEQGAGSEAARPRIAGVQLANGEQLHADLVVDCSGRQSQMPQWLAAAGLPAPRVSQVNANLGYASWLVRLDPEVAARTLKGSSGVYAIAAYPQPVGAACVAVEGGLHMVGLCTYAGQAPPFKDDQLLDFMQQHAWHPAVSEVVAGARPVTQASRFYRVTSTWRHYEEVAAALPEGLLITADAVCSFNPIYGHGMTVAALEVAKLDELLAARQSGTAAASNSSERSWLADLSRDYQQAITPIIQRVWELSVGGDLRFSSTTSTEPASAASGIMNAYFDTLMVLAASDPEVSETLLRVTHLIDESSELLTPRMLGKVLRHNLTAPPAKLWGAGLAPAGTGSESGGSTGASGAAGEAGA